MTWQAMKNVELKRITESHLLKQRIHALEASLKRAGIVPTHAVRVAPLSSLTPRNRLSLSSP